jgi:hypothetical protein
MMKEGQHFRLTKPLSSSSWNENWKRCALTTIFFRSACTHLSQINTFYLQKEAELKLRLETLLSKRKAAALRFLPDGVDDTLAAKDHVEWKAVEEGFRLLERDLGKLQVAAAPYCSPGCSIEHLLLYAAICGNQRHRFPENLEEVG